jgi:hypothetical protein
MFGEGGIGARLMGSPRGQASRPALFGTVPCSPAQRPGLLPRIGARSAPMRRSASPCWAAGHGRGSSFDTSIASLRGVLLSEVIVIRCIQDLLRRHHAGVIACVRLIGEGLVDVLQHSLQGRSGYAGMV